MTPDDARKTIVATLSRQGVTETDLGSIARLSPPQQDVDAPATLAPLVDLTRRALLGRGGMGVVHAAEQTSLAREVAVKSIVEAGDAHRRHALVVEARTMGALEHPNIVPVHVLGKDDR